MSQSKPLRVTFDTNTAAKLVTAFRAKRDGNWASYRDLPEASVLEAIEGGRVLAFATNVSLDLEGIPKADRKAYFAAFGFLSSEERSVGNNKFELILTVGSSHKVAINELQLRRYTDFVTLGGSFLKHPRIARQQLAAMVEQHLAPDVLFPMGERQERTSTLSRKLEEWGCGMSWVKAIGRELDVKLPWFKALAKAPSEWDERIANAISEWADGDAICAHFGYGNDVFCTNDRAATAGAGSVFSPHHRQRLSQEFSLEFQDLDGLGAIVSTA